MLGQEVGDGGADSAAADVVVAGEGGDGAALQVGGAGVGGLRGQHGGAASALAAPGLGGAQPVVGQLALEVALEFAGSGEGLHHELHRGQQFAGARVAGGEVHRGERAVVDAQGEAVAMEGVEHVEDVAGAADKAEHSEMCTASPGRALGGVVQPHRADPRPAYGTQLRWSAPKVIAAANEKVYGANVRTVHVLAPAYTKADPATAAAALAPHPTMPAVPTERRAPPEGYRADAHRQGRLAVPGEPGHRGGGGAADRGNAAAEPSGLPRARSSRTTRQPRWSRRAISAAARPRPPWTPPCAGPTPGRLASGRSRSACQQTRGR
ncbi:hypothetical protein ACIPD2_39330 [Streptomyces griseofuscus]|uniref:hypothetical protein n=1 Tax=Streptomyces griseofuscus TaxID=146922 RepID=UPI00380E6846